MSYIEGSDIGNAPDEIQPLDPGVYDLKVESAEEHPSKKGDSTVLHVQLSVANGESEGRQIRDFISYKMMTNLKRLAKSCGITQDQLDQGIDTEQELEGKICRAIVSQQVQKDQQTGEEITRANIRKYLIPGDEEPEA